MAITNEKIIQKMMTEIQHAKANQQNHEKMIKHIEKIHLLCELFLDEKEISSVVSEPPSQEISPEEMKAMLGKSNKPTTYQRSTLDDDEGNGDSIFDF
ncbi:YwdI family protein [Ornithinibacillus halophilus]|uniref:YwdI family protein n=1 Tax=Ornithinibacillus halophilus TaxID=930117 RepID=A0A1M5LTF0_9BACI|nr:YwdI family protein [Ornithinibacillus halophilus]SHG68404.1 hypothetical protein SAMN05216225_105018 [Ornithinibacillus halophilus]